MKRITKIFALMLILTLGVAGQALASGYQFGDFTPGGSLAPGGPFQHLQDDNSGSYQIPYFRNDVLDKLYDADGELEMFLLGGASVEHSNTLYGSGMYIELNSSTDWGAVEKHYTDVLLTELAFTYYDVLTKNYQTRLFHELAYSFAHPVPGQTGSNGEQRLISGLIMYEAQYDAIWNGMEVKKGDVLFGFCQDYNYLNGVHHPNPSNVNMVFLVRGPQSPAVPIPGAVWLMGSGIAGIAALRRRMK